MAAEYRFLSIKPSNGAWGRRAGDPLLGVKPEIRIASKRSGRIILIEVTENDMLQMIGEIQTCLTLMARERAQADA